MKYPSSYFEMIQLCNCKYAYVEICSTKDSNLDVYIFEPFNITWDIDTCEPLARAFVKQMCESHPEWNQPGNLIYANVSVGNTSRGETRPIDLSIIWNEITCK